MADIALLLNLADCNKAALHKRRIFRDRADLLSENDDWLISRFRLPRPLLLYLCNILEAKLRRETRRYHSIPAHLQVLSVLGFLATGTFQREIADRSGISQSSMSRIIPDVLDGLIRLLPQYIKFPYNLVHQLEVKQRFFAFANLPNVIGAIDCTHMGKSPKLAGAGTQ